MKVIFPQHTSLDDIEFGDEPIEKFINGGIYEDDIKGKRIFYVLEPNAFNKGEYRQQLKIGISHSPRQRFQNYYNYFGKRTPTNKCSGVRVRLILSTNKDDTKDKHKSNPNYAITSLEGKLKRRFEKSGKVLRGTEWLLLNDNTLKNNIQKLLPKSKTDIMTHSSHSTRSRMTLRPK